MLSVAETMDILRTTVGRLLEITQGAPAEHMYVVTTYGWSVNQQLAHLRSCQDILGGNIVRIVSEDHPAWKAVGPRRNQDAYFEWEFGPAFDDFRQKRALMLDVLEATPEEAWQRTATVTVPPRKVFEYSALYYGDWLAKHERGHLRQIARVLREVAT